MTNLLFSKLVEGDSGSILYYVDKDKDGRKRHKEWGMLVQEEQINTPPFDPFIIYRAVVLNQVFKDIEEDYFPDGPKLQLVKCSIQQEEQPDRQEVPQGASGGPVPFQPSSSG